MDASIRPKAAIFNVIIFVIFERFLYGIICPLPVIRMQCRTEARITHGFIGWYPKKSFAFVRPDQFAGNDVPIPNPEIGTLRCKEQAFSACFKSSIILLALGDVQAGAHHPQWLAVGIGDDPAPGVDVAPAPIVELHPVVGIVRLVLGECRGDVLLDTFPVVRMELLNKLRKAGDLLGDDMRTADRTPRKP